jgi:hypothetical protein
VPFASVAPALKFALEIFEALVKSTLIELTDSLLLVVASCVMLRSKF